MIYFAKCEQDTDELKAGMIKIGTTIRLSQRLKQLPGEYGTDVGLIAVIDGNHATEGELHRRFDHLRVVGEWFLPEEDLLDFIAAQGREWDGTDEAPPTPSMSLDVKAVKLELSLARKVAVIAKIKETTIAEYLSAMMRPGITQDYADLVRGVGGG
jgi:hypothetical protein